MSPRKDLEVRLSIPEDSEECPMMLEPMKESELDFARGLTVIKDNPLVKKMTLPCGHSFSAMATLYHFGKSGLRCPLCRQGEDGTVNFESYPEHLANVMRTQVMTKLIEDQIEEETRNVYEAWMIFVSDFSDDISFLNHHRSIHMTVYFYDSDETLPPVVPVPLTSQDFDLSVQDIGNEIHFVLPLAEVRKLGREIKLGGGYLTMEIALGLRGLHGDFLFLDRSAKFSCNNIGPKTVILGRGNAQFVVSAERTPMDFNGMSTITDVRWCVTKDNFNSWMERPNLNLFRDML